MAINDNWMGPGGTVSNPTSGDYNVANNWDKVVIPNGQNYNAIFRSSSSVYSVTYNSSSSLILNNISVGKNVDLKLVYAGADGQFGIDIISSGENRGSIDDSGFLMDGFINYGTVNMLSGSNLYQKRFANFGTLYVASSVSMSLSGHNESSGSILVDGGIISGADGRTR